jgi:bacillithiol biosynthesis cysteine-adding enzyme BshC
VASNPAAASHDPGAAGASTTPAAIDVRRFPWMRRLATDYIHNFEAVAPFFAGDPADRSAWDAAIARTHARSRDPRAIAGVIARQQERRGAPAPARAAGAELADPRTVAIVTGQQAGLFGGPLYTILKSVTALQLAARIRAEHGVPAVAVFWVEDEDHDWDEVRSCTVFDDQFATRTVSVPARSGDPVPVARIHLDDTITAALSDLEQILPPTEFRSALLDDLRRLYHPGAGMADAFARWLECVLGDQGLVVYDASDPAAKPIASPVFVRELSSPGETARLAAAAGEALVARGYHAQVQGTDGGVALFHLNDARRAVRAEGGTFVIGDERRPAAQVVEEASHHPASFSPNVLLRPIVQDTVFPTICYVAGPNELAYLGQLRSVYEHFGVPMPLMFPRATATLIDSGVVRFLQKYGVAFEALQPKDDSTLNQLLEAQIPPAVDAAFSSAVSSVESGMQALIGAIPALEPTLEGAARSTLGKMQHDLETLHGKMIQAAKRRDETLRRQFTRTRALTFPSGHPQERTVAFLSFLNQYGPALVDRLMQELPLDVGHHWVVAV